MYVKLTKKDGSPIWINASYIVTIEPARQNGSVVVPIGDGLDYDVRESPEKILRLIEGAPAPTIVPVPPPKGLAPTRPEDLSGEDAVVDEPVENTPEAKAAALTEQLKTEITVSAVPSEEPAPASEAESAAETVAEQPKKKRTTRKTKKAETAEEGTESETVPKKAAKPRARTKKAKVDFSAEQVEKLRRMAPGSVHKLRNTLKSQFRVEDPEPVIQMLVDEKVLALDQDHVQWSAI